MFVRHNCSPGSLDLARRAAQLQAEDDMQWFGKAWSAVVCRQPQVDAPVGSVCSLCDEAIRPGDSGVVFSNAAVGHRNCFLRCMIGSLAHVERRCSCYVKGSLAGDPPGMSRREAADAAVAAWEKAKP